MPRTRRRGRLQSPIHASLRNPLRSPIRRHHRGLRRRRGGHHGGLLHGLAALAKLLKKKKKQQAKAAAAAAKKAKGKKGKGTPKPNPHRGHGTPRPGHGTPRPNPHFGARGRGGRLVPRARSMRVRSYAILLTNRGQNVLVPVRGPQYRIGSHYQRGIRRLGNTFVPHTRKAQVSTRGVRRPLGPVRAGRVVPRRRRGF